jgi:hypothetical protein
MLILDNLEILVEINQSFNQKINKIMTNQKELANQLNGVTETLKSVGTGLGKVGVETTRNNELIVQLKDALSNQDNVSPEVQTAFDELSKQAGVLAEAVKAVDDMVPDQEEAENGEGGEQAQENGN